MTHSGFRFEQPVLSDSLDAAGVVGCWMHDLASDQVIADPAVARLFGIQNPDRANGDAFGQYSQAIHPADRGSFARDVAIASRQGGAIALRYRVRMSGGVHWVYDYGSFTLDEAGRPMRGQGIVIDITGRQTEVDAVDEMGVLVQRDEAMQAQVEEMAKHVLSTSEIARTLPSAKLRASSDSLMWEMGRLLAWISRTRRI